MICLSAFVVILYLTVSVWVCNSLLQGLDEALETWRESVEAGRATRNESLKRLDLITLENGLMTILSRMTMMAPLIGVLLTACGFLMFNITESADDPSHYFRAMRPLYIGVGVGAVLALLNTAVVMFASHRLRRSRHDEIDFLLTRLPESEAAQHVEQTMERIAIELTKFVGQLTGLGKSMEETGAKVIEIADAKVGRLSHGVERFHSWVEQVDDSLGTLTANLDTGGEQLENASRLIGPRFEKVIESLTGALDRHAERSQRLISSTDKTIEKMNTLVVESARQVTGLTATIQATLPAHNVQQMLDAVKQLCINHQQLLTALGQRTGAKPQPKKAPSDGSWWRRFGGG